MITEQIEFVKVVMNALSTHLVAVEATAELGCAADALAIELNAWPVGEELTIAAYCFLLERAVERARRMMAGEECDHCRNAGLDPLLHNVSRRKRIGVFPSVHR